MSSLTKTRKVTLTAALPYSNGRLHVGHLAGAYVPADITARYLRLTGAEVRFICGSDDHGVAIMLTAEKEGKTPREVADLYREKQREDFKGIGMTFDIYSGTSSNPYHTKASQEFFKTVWSKGYFEKKGSRQFYDQKKGVFLPDRYVKGICAHCGTKDQNGDQCENCGNVLDVDTLRDAISIMSGEPAVIKETVHWFLDLSRFRSTVEAWLSEATVRESTRSFVRGLIDGGLVKRAMTRDIPWGVPVPLDDPDAAGKVLYVWFDAPIGYISNTMELCADRGEGAEAYANWWKSSESEIYHFIGEDNTIFHCVIWIAMLAAEGSFHLPTGVIVNHYLNMQFAGAAEEKMSKSRGTALWVGEYLESGGDVDALRYYLTLVAPEKARTAFSPEDFAARRTSDLANTLGNFVNRILSFSLKHYGTTVPAYDLGLMNDTDKRFIERMHSAFNEAEKQFEAFSPKSALDALMDFCRECNRYVDEQAPWKTRKTDDERTKLTLALAIRAIRMLAITLSPIIPIATEKVLKALSIDKAGLKWKDAVAELAAGSPISVPEILFKPVESNNASAA